MKGSGAARVAALLASFVLLRSPAARADARFAVDQEAGNNTFTAVFDAAIGERITAVSSAVACTLAVDEAKLEGKASCSVPLTSIRVDNDDVKSEHFRQWATNKTVDPKKCVFALEVPAVKLAGPVEWTAGWLARVQQLAPVVATAGTIDVSLFAMEPEAQ